MLVQHKMHVISPSHVVHQEIHAEDLVGIDGDAVFRRVMHLQVEFSLRPEVAPATRKVVRFEAVQRGVRSEAVVVFEVFSALVARHSRFGVA